MAFELPFKLNRPDLLNTQSYVGGQWVSAQSNATFDVVDPGTDKPWARVSDNAAADVSAAVQAAQDAFLQYRTVSPRTRAQWLYRWDALIKEHKQDIATILVYETGKPFAEAIGELDYSLSFTWWFAGEAERIQGTVFTPALPGRRVLTIKQPLGVAAALVPWNFPIAMVLRKAGFPPGVLNILPTSLENTPALSEALCRHPLVKKISFTGSTRIGKLITSHCTSTLKKVTLELGGNCPALIFNDVNIDQAMAQLVGLKWRHAGQACVTVNRFIVQSGVYDAFLARFAAETAKLVVGHGAAPATTMGPVTTPRGVERAEKMVADAFAKGARLVCGGKRAVLPGDAAKGYFFEPTILADMSPDALVSCEEVFAPIAAFYRFETEEEGVRMANDTPMGLASYAFTKDLDRMWRLFENLEAGMIGLNTGNSSAAESPFGGMKDSGYGKESGKDVAVNEYLVTKTGTLTLEGV
ncbi:Succinate-semialdehyde dehydrogenase [Neofusicoccum parvum]|uniref:Succinate-semialdehyde dehydrogenase n=1 Tax=Neofusicoccum parvum TaxID=310453 RepID=A0ACB5SMV0_9PEZI|nr:Succinate-semialdehyde dehydrogenase [Neofusicoccum parvum]